MAPSHKLPWRSVQNYYPAQMGASPDGMFDNKLINQSHMCGTSSFHVVWVDVFGVQVTDRSFCEVERRFGGRQQRRLIDTDSYSTLCGTVWNKAAGFSSLWDTSFTSPRHQRCGARRGVLFDRWADRVEQIQEGNGEIGRRRIKTKNWRERLVFEELKSSARRTAEHSQTERVKASTPPPPIQEMHESVDHIYIYLYI